MKYSLTTIRKVTVKRRRRRPLQSMESQTPTNEGTGSSPDINVSDKRAIKKATSLVMDGCVSKATRVLDQEIVAKSLSDDDTLAKLRDLHPDLPVNFQIPQDAPITACITPDELREAGRTHG